MSQETFQSFLIDSIVHLLLEFFLCHITQYTSCCAHHSADNHPSSAASHPSLVCLSETIVLSVKVDLDLQACNPCVRVWMRVGLDCSSFVHCVRAATTSIHQSVTSSWVHLLIWGLSYWLCPHQGQFAEVHCCQQTIFFPCAKWPDICFDAHLHFERGTLFMAQPSEDQSTSFSWSGVYCFHCAQYCSISLLLMNF